MWELHRLDQVDVRNEALELERAEAEAAGVAPIPPSMVIACPRNQSLGDHSTVP